jgi:glutamyl/glutaminyl-tRNA synthetase
MADGKAYRCFCTEDELEKVRLQQVANHEPPRYNGKCREMIPGKEGSITAEIYKSVSERVKARLSVK